MEFPHLGQHCNEKTCNRLDFLPMKCDACNQVYCSSHFNYENHNCSTGLRKDYQVPLCPLCGEPVPTAPGVEPDLTVGQHIDKQCKSDSRKIFTNRCSYKSCKRKELIPVNCSQCKLNFCLRHRHTTDHECQSKAGASSSNQTYQQRTMAGKAAEQRRTQKPPNSLFNSAPKPTTAAVRAAATQRLTAGSRQTQTIQGNMTEDEALARAIALSIMELDETNDRNRRNETAAADNNAQQRNNTTVPPVGGRDQQQTASGKDKCSLS